MSISKIQKTFWWEILVQAKSGEFSVKLNKIFTHVGVLLVIKPQGDMHPQLRSSALGSWR